MRLIIERRYEIDCTLGTATLRDEFDNIVFQFKTLELPYKDNQRGISCIKEGLYTLKKNRWQTKFGNHFDIIGCEPRQGVKMHAGNYTSQIRGCVLPGTKHVFLNKDNTMDISNSKATLEHLFSLCPDELQLEIRSL